MNTTKNIFFGIVFTILSTLVLVLGAEFALFVGNKALKVQRFSVINHSAVDVPASKLYPKHPEQYLKIAVFGGSAARGYNSERAFSDMLPSLLEGQVNGDKKVFVRNYAEDGRPFHRFEAELAVEAAPRYDVLIVYAGTNESLNYFDDIRYFLKPEHKHVDLTAKPNITMMDRVAEGKSEEPVTDFFERKSRLYALALRITDSIKARLKPKSSSQATNYFRNAQFKVFEPNHVVSPSEREKLNQNFARDLKRVVEQAKTHGKKVVFMTETPDETFTPFCSVIEERLDSKRRGAIEAAFLEAQDFYEKKQPGKAETLLRGVLGQSPGLAAALHLQGLIAFDSERWPEAWKNFRAAIDNDCFPFRTLTPLHQTMSTVASQYDNVTVVDAAAFFRKLRQSAYSAEELFSDVVHPNILGHYVLALLVVKGMDQTGATHASESIDAKLNGDLRAAAQAMAEHLLVTQEERNTSDFYRARWNLSMAFRSGNSKKYLEWSRAQIKNYIKMVGDTSAEVGDGYMYLSLTYAVGGDTAQAVQWLNEAYRREPGRVMHRYATDVTATGNSIRSILDGASIEFDPKANAFHKR